MCVCVLMMTRRDDSRSSTAGEPVVGVRLDDARSHFLGGRAIALAAGRADLFIYLRRWCGGGADVSTADRYDPEWSLDSSAHPRFAVTTPHVFVLNCRPIGLPFPPHCISRGGGFLAVV